jgi:hypothetical protein
MVGSHSSGDAATHKLIPIVDAYETALTESTRNDPILEGRRAAIKEHLAALDAKLLDVNKNSAEVEEQIYQLLQVCYLFFMTYILIQHMHLDVH